MSKRWAAYGMKGATIMLTSRMTLDSQPCQGMSVSCLLVVGLLVGVWGAAGTRAQDAGSIVGWGVQVTVPQSALTDLVAVAAGDEHSLGVKADGAIVAWGYNGFGQCDVPVPNSGFVAAAGGGYFSLGLKTNGSIVAWGDNGPGDPPAPNSGFVAVAAGMFHSLGLRVYPLGDLNCDCRVTFADIDAFVLALWGPAAYHEQYPDCDWLNGDCNGDGHVTFADIDPFVALIGTTCP